MVSIGLQQLYCAEDLCFCQAGAEHGAQRLLVARLGGGRAAERAERVGEDHARALKERGKLAGNKVVTTVMSNFGLYKALDEAGIENEKTAVGDKYVYENMSANGYRVGGEQSGHVIFLEYASTGDGELTALQFMSILKESGRKCSEIAAEVVPWPQVMINVKVPNDQKATLQEKPEIKADGGDDAQLWACNKWLLAHPDSSEAKTGAHIGLTGKNIDILDA